MYDKIVPALILHQAKVRIRTCRGRDNKRTKKNLRKILSQEEDTK